MTDAVVNQAADHDEPAGAEVQALLDKLGVCPTSDLISVLQQVQDSLGYLPATWQKSHQRCPIRGDKRVDAVQISGFSR